MVAIFFVLVTHFTKIFIYYVEKDILMYKNVFVHEKPLLMIERVITWAIFLLPGWWSLGLLVIWIELLVIKHLRLGYSFSWTSILLGNILAVIFGFLTKIVIYL